jgi:ABC-2 type transport system ATP-binding protein
LIIRGYGLRDAERRTGFVFEELELEKYARLPVSRLSGGLAKRVMLAAVFADESTEVLLLDEPLPGLDVKSRIIFWSFYSELLGMDAWHSFLLTTLKTCRWWLIMLW